MTVAGEHLTVDADLEQFAQESGFSCWTCNLDPEVRSAVDKALAKGSPSRTVIADFLKERYGLSDAHEDKLRRHHKNGHAGKRY